MPNNPPRRDTPDDRTNEQDQPTTQTPAGAATLTPTTTQGSTIGDPEQPDIEWDTLDRDPGENNVPSAQKIAEDHPRIEGPSTHPSDRNMSTVPPWYPTGQTAVGEVPKLVEPDKS